MAVQDHIHLGATLGGAPENAPTAKYRVTQRNPFHKVEASVSRSLTGKLFFDRVIGSGSPVVFTDFDYYLLVTVTEFNTLAALLGKSVYLVDNDHVADSSDHTAYVKTMVFATLKYVKRLDPMLNNSIVAISLIDDNSA